MVNMEWKVLFKALQAAFRKSSRSGGARDGDVEAYRYAEAKEAEDGGGGDEMGAPVTIGFREEMAAATLSVTYDFQGSVSLVGEYPLQLQKGAAGKAIVRHALFNMLWPLKQSNNANDGKERRHRRYCRSASLVSANP